MENFPGTIDVNMSHADERSTVVNQSLFNLEQIKGAYETEAESHILQAIEDNEISRFQKQQENNHGDENHESFRNSKKQEEILLTGVPSHAAYLFDPVTTEGIDNTTAATAAGVPSTSAPTPPPSLTPTMSTKLSLHDAAKMVRMMNLIAAKNERNTQQVFENNKGEENNEENKNQHYNDGEQNPLSNPSTAPTATLGKVGDLQMGKNETSDPESQTNYQPISTDNHQDMKLFDSSLSKTNKFKKRLRCAVMHAFSNSLGDAWRDIKFVLAVWFYFMIPCLGLSTILYYFAGNPIGPFGGSYSWWLQFMTRLGITFVLSKITQFILIDFIAIETSLAVMAVGRVITLMTVQAKGWPLISIFWALWNFTVLYGDHGATWITFEHSAFNLFSPTNPPALEFLSSGSYQRVLIAMIVVGVIVMVKRLFFSLLLGKRTYVTFGGRMESLMQRVLLIAEVAMLAREIEYSVKSGEKISHDLPRNWNTPANRWFFDRYRNKNEEDGDERKEEEDDDDDIERTSQEDKELYKLTDLDDETVQQEAKPKSTTNMWSRLHKKSIREPILELQESDKEVIATLLGEWEEPQITKKFSWQDISIRKILQFREALSYLDGKYPLSAPFGAAETRKECMVSAQKVYRKLIMKSPESSILHFDTLATLAVDRQGKFNKDKARALIRLFRPDREGNLTMLDFVKSCDKIYKKMKTFRVATYNAVQLDEALEKICNVLFFVILGVIVAMIFEISPLQVFAVLSAPFLSISFLFSSAASNYFQGLLLILARQPYDIGDRIAISHPSNDTSPSGSTTWFVDGITLFTTTVRNAATNEVGTYDNGSLASLRIINAARSPKAVVYVKLKFGIDVPYEKVKIFGTVIEHFVKDRPREWIKLVGFRATVVEADLGYIGYVLVLNHVESWQNVGAILQSQADVASFCLEVSKQMDMRFIAPPMPIDLNMENMHVKNPSIVAASDVIEEASEHVDAPNLSNFEDPNGIQRIQNLFRNSTKQDMDLKKKN